MTISDKDLFLAILSMDSYNRGYGAGINDSANNDQDGLGVSNAVIGSATISFDISTQAAQNAGFYAAAYSWNNQTVISYRGTNFSSGAAQADIFNGWQLRLAISWRVNLVCRHSFWLP